MNYFISKVDFEISKKNLFFFFYKLKKTKGKEELNKSILQMIFH